MVIAISKDSKALSYSLSPERAFPRPLRAGASVGLTFNEELYVSRAYVYLPRSTRTLPLLFRAWVYFGLS